MPCPVQDSYAASNQSVDSTLNPSGGGYLRRGQSFQATYNGDLKRVGFWLKLFSGTPSGNAVACLYAHTGAFGTNTGLPTGSPLATSNNFSVASLTSTYSLIYFDFPTPYPLVFGTYYVVTIEFLSGGGVLSVGGDNTSPTHPGASINWFTSWSADATLDHIFSVETDPVLCPGPPVGLVTPIPFFRLPKHGLFRARQPKLVTPVLPTYGPFTEFYCDPVIGSNLNSGSDQNGTALYTSTNGGWTSPVFTPSDGTNPAAAGVMPGQFASIYIDGATTAVCTARILSVVNAPNGAITVSTVAFAGILPTNLGTTRSIKVGGAWAGGQYLTTHVWPFNLQSLTAATNVTGNPPRVNFKNNGTYLFVNFGLNINGSNVVAQGYTSTPGDGGKAVFSNSNVTAGGNQFSPVGQSMAIFDIIFENTGTTLSNTLCNPAIAGGVYVRCVFRGARAWGCNASSGLFYACEFYNNNRAVIGAGGLVATGVALYVNCYFHDNTGAGACGANVNSNLAHFFNCIFANNAGDGLTAASSSSGGGASVHNCDFYNNGGNGITAQASSAQMFALIRNCNFFKNNRAIAMTVFAQNGLLLNNAYGSGNMANSQPDVIPSCIVQGKIVYPPGFTPWSNPDAGNFKVVYPAAFNAGASEFTEVDGTHSGTVGYPDIGAAAAFNRGLIGGGGITEGEDWLPYGYVGYYYSERGDSATILLSITVDSGALPPGLSLVQLTATQWAIQGTPTLVGDYNWTLKLISTAGAVGYAYQHITIQPDPDEGVGAVGGG